jgi:5-methylthioribose kinase
MDHQKKKDNVKQFINPELCDITEALVYEEPFHIGARNDIEEKLIDFHEEFIVGDGELKREVAKLKFDFMNNGQALLHGDLHTGSIFINQESTKVIDPEFAFYGPMAYDIGAVIANLIMNYISTKARVKAGEKQDRHLEFLRVSIKDTIDMFVNKSLDLWNEVVTDKMAKSEGFKEWYIRDVLVNTAGVTGCEMIRRTVGFAHVKDLDIIPNEDTRIEAKKVNLKLAVELIKNRDDIVTGDDYLNLINKI